MLHRGGCHASYCFEEIKAIGDHVCKYGNKSKLICSQTGWMLCLSSSDAAVLAASEWSPSFWYDKFKPFERAIVSDFVTSLLSTAPSQSNHPSVAQWWKTIEKYYHITSKKSSISLSLGKRILDDKYSLSKSLKNKQIVELASMGDQKNAISSRPKSTPSSLTFGWVTPRPIAPVNVPGRSTSQSTDHKARL
ncbi:hypothetical protein J1N35_030345 [Gossypium stocksii]|uniref:Uncharacterized protein n=1 Tax=Gossypium stocksii TaxID=47602 RepID=A0A9D3UZF3_9ROSI|nr:hypothetical protein J1N35_030345 [Gossypium stocksii]